MRWIRTADGLPQHNQEVLLRHQGILYLAVYDQEKRVFVTKEGNIVKCGDQDSWSAFVGSEVTPK